MKHIQLLVFAFLSTTSLFATSSDKIDSLSNLALELFSRDIDSTLIVSQQMIEEGKKADNTFAVVRGLYFNAYIFDELKGNTYKGIIEYLEATKYYELHPQKEATYDIASIYENLGRNFTDFGQLEIALDFFAKAYNRYSEIDNQRGLADVLIHQSETYIELNDTVKAIQLIDSAIIHSAALDEEDKARVFNEVGIRVESLNMYQKALLYYNKAYLLVNKENDTSKEFTQLKVFAIHNIGKTKALIYEFEDAKKYLHESHNLRLKNKALFTPWNMYNSYKDLALCFHLSKEYDSAIYYYEKAHEVTSQFEVSAQKHDFIMYKEASKAFELAGNLQKSLEYSNHYKKHLESYIERKETAQLEHQKLNLELITQKYFNDSSSNEIEAKVIWFGGLASMVIFLLVAYILRSAYKRHQVKRVVEREINNLKKL
jgi:tetratricopeptide (TPR) repeat protein